MDQLRKSQKFGWFLPLRHMKPCKRLPKEIHNYDKSSFFFEFVLVLTTSNAGIALLYIFFI